MSQPCAMTTCKKPSRALCYCCQQGLCIQHLKEHNDLLLSQLNPLVDQINGIGDRLKSINIHQKLSNCREILERWRDDCHKKIDNFFEQKYQDINQRIITKVEKQREEIDQIQKKIVTLMHEEEVSRQDITLLTSTLEELEKEVHKIERIHLDIETQPLVIDDSLIFIEESDINRFNLCKLTSAYKTIEYTNKSWVSLAINDRFLLTHQYPNLCLIDRNLEIVQQTAWDYENIRSICWSLPLNRFIIVSEKGVFSFNETTLSIEMLQVDQDRNWMSCTCSDTSLFVSTYALASSVIEYSLLPRIELIKEWKSPDTCQKESWINDMKYSHGSIALLIKNPSEKILLFELRDIKTFNHLWSLQWTFTDVTKLAFHCCLLNDEEWMVINHESDRLVHITKDGKIKSSCPYKSTPHCATILGPDIIAISTNREINFHKLSS